MVVLQVVLISMMVLNTYLQPINDELIILMELLSRGILTLTIAFGLLFLDTTGVFSGSVRLCPAAHMYMHACRLMGCTCACVRPACVWLRLSWPAC